MTAAIEIGLLVATVGCVLANGFETVAKTVKARFVMNNSAQVRLRPVWLPYLALLEGLGTAGLILGLAGLRTIGTAAAVGLVLFFIGAIVAHIRTKVLYNIAFPLAFLLLAVAALAYFTLPAV